MESPSPKALLDQLQALVNTDDVATIPRETRFQACQLAHKLWLELQEQGDLIDRTNYQFEENALLKVGMDLGIYKYLAEKNGPASTEEIAKISGCDPILMGRILRFLAAMHHVQEVDVDLFAANKLTQAFNSPKGISMQHIAWDWARHVWLDLPAWLKSINYQNPWDHTKTALNHAWNYEKHFFDFLKEHDLIEIFQLAMSHYRVDRAEFLETFPAEKVLIPGADEKGVMLVDVGGGHGHEIQRFVEKFPDTKGRHVLEDLPEVVQGAPKSDAFEVVEHDFLKPQPVKGARAYYFRMIFHDWPDPPSLEILKHTAAAMKPGYSKLLINDTVMPSKGATRFAAQSDINMMLLFAASERPEEHWRRLLGQAGLKIVKIWPGVPECVIEAELA